MGKVYLVGAGPGDPGLLTLKAMDVIQKADAVLYDALIHPRILSLIPDRARRIFRGSRGKAGALSQGQINRRLVRLALHGKTVVRLKGGDPFVFGRGGEEVQALVEARVPFEVVPGVTSAVAVPAYAGIPVTHRRLTASFTVVTGHEDPSKEGTQVDWGNLAENNGTLVFLMGLHALPEVCARLVEKGKDPATPAAVIQWGTTSRQKVAKGTLATLPSLVRKAGLQPPATLIVGKVVPLGEKFEWFMKKPLSGLRVLVTRGRAQASHLSGMLEEAGAEVLEIPTIEIHPLPLTGRDKAKLDRINRYDWLVFSSVNAVEIFMQRLVQCRKDARGLGKLRIACVGASTAKALARFGLRADLVPGDYKQEGLVREFQKIKITGKRLLLARAKEGRELLAEFLRKKGAAADLLPLYENRAPRGVGERLRRLLMEEDGVDLVTFASSSAVEHFYRIFAPRERRRLKGMPVAAIGPVTARTVRQWGGKLAVQPRIYTLEALVSAVVKWAGKKR